MVNAEPTTALSALREPRATQPTQKNTSPIIAAATKNCSNVLAEGGQSLSNFIAPAPDCLG